MGVTAQPLTRERLEAACETVIRRGGWKAGLWTATIEGQPVFIKDVRHSHTTYRWFIGRWLLRNEANVYRRIGERSLVPRFLGAIDNDAIVIERLEGTHLGKCDAKMRTAELFDRLHGCVRDLHACGVLHLDLRSRRNIIIARDGRPFLIDFGNSLYAGRGVFGQRVLIPLLGWIDHSAIRKFRQRDLSAEEVSRNRTRDRLRRILWPWPRLWRAMGVNRRLKSSVHAAPSRTATAPPSLSKEPSVNGSTR